MIVKGIKKANNQSASTQFMIKEFTKVHLGDRRLDKRLVKIVESLVPNSEKSIPQACENWAKTKAAYRLLGNKKVNPDALLDGHRQQTIGRIKQQQTIFIVQDTCTIDYSSHTATKGLGPHTTEKSSLGILMHSALALNTDGTPLGLLSQKYWTRNPVERGKSKLRYELPIELKESYKWLEMMDQSLVGIPEKIKVITIADREADIFELFQKARREQREFLIRATHDRRVAQEQKRLYELLNSTPVSGECLVQIPRNSELNLPPREANLAVKYFPVSICPPFRAKDKSQPNVELYAVWAKEISPPKGIEPVQWLLLTTLKVTTLAEATEKIDWYRHRWKIERFHYTLKSGCKIEDLQFGTDSRLINAIALYSVLAWRLTWITYQSRETPEIPCTLILNDYEWKLLYCQVHGVNRPPKKIPTLKEAVILIARLGGFLARKHDGDPGIKVLWRGFHELHSLTKAYQYLSSVQLT